MSFPIELPEKIYMSYIVVGRPCYRESIMAIFIIRTYLFRMLGHFVAVKLQTVLYNYIATKKSK